MIRRPCSSCGAPMLMVPTVKGNKMPLDPEPVADGNVRIGQVGGDDVALVLAGAELAAAQLAGPVYKSHFATCPNADDHRRGAA